MLTALAMLLAVASSVAAAVNWHRWQIANRHLAALELRAFDAEVRATLDRALAKVLEVQVRDIRQAVDAWAALNQRTHSPAEQTIVAAVADAEREIRAVVAAKTVPTVLPKSNRR